MKHVFSSQFGRLAVLLSVDAVFFGISDPANVPPFMLIIAFILFVLTLYQVVKGVLWLGSWYGLQYSGHRLRLARMITAALAVVVALQSMNQLSGRDLLVLIPLVTLAYLYFMYGQTSQERLVAQE